MNSNAKADDQELDDLPAEDLVEAEMVEDEDLQDDTQVRIEELEQQLRSARDRELRAQADYQNLSRRTMEDRNKMARMASQEVIENILQPLDHLLLAKLQLQDKGLDMVWQQFKQVLSDQGLEEIEVMGKKFDEQIMEVIDKVKVEDKKQVEKVVKVTQPGYKLNGEVIRVAKVVIGE